jgi:hypothetical protein
MKRAKNVALTVGVLLAGLTGGALFTWLSGGSPVQAQSVAGLAKSMIVSKLVVVDDQGRPRIRLEVDDKGPQLALLDEAGRPRAYAGRQAPPEKSQPGYWIIGVLDAAGKMRALSAARDDGHSSSMQVRDDKGAIRFNVAFTEEGNGALILKDQHDRERFVVGMPPHAGYSMNIVDANGEKIWSAPGPAAPSAPVAP